MRCGDAVACSIAESMLEGNLRKANQKNFEGWKGFESYSIKAESSPLKFEVLV